MVLPPPFEAFPESFPAHSRDASQRRYRYRSGWLAAPTSVVPEEATTVVYILPAEGLVVCSGELPAVPARGEVRPVYALSAAERPAVPTGRVFAQTDAAHGDVAKCLTQLPYEVESVPVYATNAAWLVAKDGSIGAALANLEQLIAHRDIAIVEPQMLRPVAPR